MSDDVITSVLTMLGLLGLLCFSLFSVSTIIGAAIAHGWQTALIALALCVLIVIVTSVFFVIVIAFAEGKFAALAFCIANLIALVLIACVSYHYVDTNIINSFENQSSENVSLSENDNNKNNNNENGENKVEHDFIPYFIPIFL